MRHPLAGINAVSSAAGRAAPVALALLMSLTACGGTKSATAPSTPATNPPVASSPTAATSSSAERFGHPITVTTADGYRYVLRASAPHSEPTVDFPMGAETTPPGKTHVVIDVQVENPLTDRQEPLGDELTDTIDDGTQFDLAVPMVDGAVFGLSNQATSQLACGDRSPADRCFFGGWLAVPSDYASATTQVDPGATVFLQITEIGGVPEAAPLNHVSLYVWDGTSEVQVPPAK